MYRYSRTFNRCIQLMIGLCFLLPSVSGFAQSDVSDARIKAILTQRIDTDKQSVGMVIGMIDASGRRLISHGATDRTSGIPVDGKTIYEIGSITKVFTSMVLADMIERGEVGLDDPIRMYLPQGVSAPTRDGKEITLRHLANHTSALPRLPDNVEWPDLINPYAEYSSDLLYDFLKQHELRRNIGEIYEYSNLGAGLLGTLLSRKADRSYEQLVLSRITDPLGMPDTRITLSAEQKQRLATGHDLMLEAVENWDFLALAGAGAIRSNANDLMTFLSAHMGLTDSNLSATIAHMQQAWQETGGPGMEIGLGWHARSGHGTKIVWHNGGTHGYRSFIGMDMEHKRAVVVLSNSFNDPDDIGFHLMNSAYPLKESPSSKEVIAVNPAILSEYTGEYEFAPQAILTITKSGETLSAQLTGQPAFPIFAESETKFFYKVVDAQMTFGRNDANKVTHLIMTQNGLDRKAQKRNKTGDPLPVAERQEMSVARDIPQKYVGDYELQPGFIITVTVDQDVLMVQATGQPANPVFAESETRFFYKVVNAQIEFKIGNDGQVEGLTLFQGGAEMFAPRQ